MCIGMKKNKNVTEIQDKSQIALMAAASFFVVVEALETTTEKIERTAGKWPPKKTKPFAPKKYKKLCYNVLNLKCTIPTFAPLNTTTQ